MSREFCYHTTATCTLSTAHILNICFTLVGGGQVLISNNLGNVSDRNTSGAFALLLERGLGE